MPDFVQKSWAPDFFGVSREKPEIVPVEIFTCFIGELQENVEFNLTFTGNAGPFLLLMLKYRYQGKTFSKRRSPKVKPERSWISKRELN